MDLSKGGRRNLIPLYHKSRVHFIGLTNSWVLRLESPIWSTYRPDWVYVKTLFGTWSAGT